MAISFTSQQLFESVRWREFVTSTSLGLQVNLVVFSKSGAGQLNINSICPFCGAYNAPPAEERLVSIVTEIGDEVSGFRTSDQCETYAMKLPDRNYLLVRNFNCCGQCATPSLEFRAKTALRLISYFQDSLHEQVRGGEKAIELSALRQMNHIVLSMFQQSGQSLANALDLILSSLVILLEAKGSWLQYSRGEETFTMIKGEIENLDGYLNQKHHHGVVKDFSNANIRGVLGVAFPDSFERAATLLQLMIEECIIAFEIDTLFHLVSEQYVRVFGSLQSGIIIFDADRKIIYANEACVRLLEIDYLSLVGQEANRLEAPWIDTLYSLSPAAAFNMDYFLINSKQKWIDWKMNPLIDKGQLIGYVVMIDDKTDYYNWLEASRLAERFATSATMVGALAHELRNPLTAAMSLLQMIAIDHSRPERAFSYVDLVTKELDRINRLLNEFLLLGKPSKMTSEQIYIDSFIMNLAPLLQGEAMSKSVEISFDIQPVAPIIGDVGQLTQVMLNLVRNAVEAVNEQGKVSVTVRQKADRVALTVADNGPGITEDIAEKMFQPFFTTKVTGTGLGLPIIKAIISNHGGRITLSEENGLGAEFRIEIPSLSPRNGLMKLDILIIIRDEIIRHSYGHALQAIGYRVLAVRDLSTLPQLANDYIPAVVLVDQATLSGKEAIVIRDIWPEAFVLIKEDRSQGDGDILGKVEVLPDTFEYTKILAQIQANIGKPG